MLPAGASPLLVLDSTTVMILPFDAVLVSAETEGVEAPVSWVAICG